MERKAVEQADVVLAVSREERWGFIERYGADPGRVIEVPNGADTALCVPARSDEKEDAKQKLGLPSKPAILFVGNDNPPNRAGLRWVGRLAAQAPQFAFVVVGEVGQGPRVDGNLITTGYVEDYRPYLRAADIGFCPIQYGAGTKIKMMEYLAAGLPTVAFVESLRGTEFRDGEHLLVAKAEEGAILEAFQRLVRNPDISANLSVAAREYMVEHHDWSRIAASLETALVTAP